MTLGLSAGPASAAFTHPLVGSFNGSDSTAGAFTGLAGIAVDQASGAVYGLDFGSGHLDKFSASGASEPFSALSGATSIPISNLDSNSTVAVDNTGGPTNGNIYVTAGAESGQGGELLGFASSGSPLPGFPIPLLTPFSVAVDPSGHVWVADLNQGLREYDASGNLLEVTTELSARTMAFDASGDLYASMLWGNVNKYDPDGSGGFSPDPTTPMFDTSGQAKAVALDPVSGHVYVAHAGLVDDYDSSGNLVNEFGSGTLQNTVGLAAASANGYLYAADNTAGGSIDIFGPLGTYADVTTGPPTNVTPTSATFTGTVNPDGVQVTDCHFDYGTTNSYGQTAPCAESVGAGTSDVQVHADVTGLQPGAGYHFRLVAVNASGAASGKDSFFGPPLVNTTFSSAQGPTQASFEATVTPQNLDTTYHLEYGPTTSYGQSTPESGSIGSDDTAHSVSGDLTGLTPNTTYHFRVVATNASGAVDGPDRTLTTTPAALIDVQPPTGMTNPNGLATGTATLNALIDPQGTDTSYHFEYGTTSGYGASTPSTDAGSADAPNLQSAQISGLAPATTYHYRTVATNSLGTVNGPDSTFTTPPSSCPNSQERTGASASLPECRAYERVSPADKAGYAADAPIVASTGDRVGYTSEGVFAGQPNEGVLAPVLPYVAHRTSAGWVSAGTLPPPSLGMLDGAVGNSADLGSALSDVTFRTINTIDPNLQPTGALILRRPDGSFVQASPTASSVDGEPVGPLVSGQFATGDLSHIFFPYPGDAGGQATLLPQAPVNRNSLYELVGAGGSPSLRLASLDPSGQPVGLCDKADADGISPDGSKVIFTASTNPTELTCIPAAIYARIDGSSTVNLSDPSPNDACTTAACQGSRFAAPWFAGQSADASRVFFTSAQQLTDEASQGPVNLYEYDFNRPSGHNLVDLSAGDTSGLGPQVQGVVRVADSGSAVYFVARGLLSSQPNSLGQSAQAGADNLYHYDTASGNVSFIAELCSGPGISGAVTDVTQCQGAPGDQGDPQSPGADLNPTSGLTNHLGFSISDATPDGRFLVFTTYAQLTPDDTNQAADLYEYDTQTGGIWRVSVGHDGQDQNGNGGGQDVAAGRNLSSGLGGSNGATVGLDQRTVSDDGQTVVFTTNRPLQNTATNGKSNVYEWHQGEVTLISGGQSPLGSAARPAITPSGQDIVFETDQGLLAQDTDGLVDIYDARIGGGFAPVPTPAPCQADACQPSGGGAPPIPPAATVTFVGPGNPRSGRARVITRRVHGPSFVIAVRVPGPGHLTVSGVGVRTARTSIRRAGTRRIHVKLTARARSALKHRHRLHLTLRVTYAPAGGSPGTVLVHLTDER